MNHLLRPLLLLFRRILLLVPNSTHPLLDRHHFTREHRLAHGERVRREEYTVRWEEVTGREV